MKITDFIDQKWLGWRGAVLLTGLGAGLFGLTKLVQYIFTLAI